MGFKKELLWGSEEPQEEGMWGLMKVGCAFLRCW